MFFGLLTDMLHCIFTYTYAT